MSRRVRKYYVGYFAGKRSFFTIEVQRQRLTLYFNLDPAATTPWNDEAMRDVLDIGHYALGDTEYSLRNLLRSTRPELDQAGIRENHLVRMGRHELGQRQRP